MWLRSKALPEPPDIETLRRNSRILVIDDQEFPAQTLFERDHYDIQRWAEVNNLTQLTDGYFKLILLDIEGVGLNESPDLQGLGILQHIKHSRPTQAVIAYSSKNRSPSKGALLELADGVLDKRATYVEYKTAVDDLLIRSSSPGYFISLMNKELAEQAVYAPAAVGKALAALRKGHSRDLEKYLRASIPDSRRVETILTIINIGIEAAKLISA